MAEMDNLIGSHLSLISQQDVRYDGILFSINSKESSIVLRDGMKIFLFILIFNKLNFTLLFIICSIITSILIFSKMLWI